MARPIRYALEYCSRDKYGIQFVERYEMRNGQMTGKYERTYADGRIVNGSYQNGVEHGIQETHYPDGFVSTFKFRNGMYYGRARYRAYEGIYNIRYKNDIPEGKATLLYTNGCLETFHYTQGILSGPATREYPNQFIEHFTYVNGVPSGPARMLDAKGLLVESYFYENGKKVV